ncbi:S8 family peptidase [Pseudomonas benzenivorans]|uniref:S8 family serine peptidase n=1 Tax=Pseudomonas benzenivorans TaxID=556533 RepID=A0ABY5H6S3_9PSED|nr:S8 family peptidase [Pseudomonas benzenivorans]UTW07823.1 S8 family serine peptidase [Pseudomonas benzenivorans]
MTFAAPDIGAARINTSTLKEGKTYDRFIVKYRAGSSELASSSMRAQALNQAGMLQGLGVGHLRRTAVGADVIKSARKLDRAGAEALMQQIAANPNVEYVEVDALLKPVYTPNDSRYNEQWHYYEATAGINAPTAWDRSTGNGVVVAVLDTGITSHPDLNANVIAGYDLISDTQVANDGNGRDADPSDPGDWTTGQCDEPSDSSWHGTHVAGTVAAVTNNTEGVAGVAFNAKIMPVRVLGTCGGYTSDIADGIIWASGGSVSGVPTTSTPAKVINMSLGGGGSCSMTTQNAINSAVGRGTTVVVAAGNSNADANNFNPANCNNVITVAATTRSGSRSSFSNYGSVVDLAAPGSGILSTLNSGTTTPASPSYAAYNGTSMAAPHIAGVVALMQAAALKTPAQVESNLKSTARALPGTCSGGCGTGLVDARAAVDAQLGSPPVNQDNLFNGQPVTGLSGSKGSTKAYSITVPAGVSSLTVTLSGGSGDADLYVRFGSVPTTGSYDCRPYRNGNNETCTFASPQAGTYHVMVRGYSSYSGVSLVARH